MTEQMIQAAIQDGLLPGSFDPDGNIGKQIFELSGQPMWSFMNDVSRYNHDYDPDGNFDDPNECFIGSYVYIIFRKVWNKVCWVS
jgi:hypothetical protein